MAETLVSSLLGPIFQKLTDEALKKFARSQKIHSELNELKDTLSRIQALLNDASRKEITDESVGQWINSLQHLAYDIDDVLDDVATQAMHRDQVARKSAAGQFTACKVVRNAIPTCCTNLSLTQSLHHKLDSITDKLRSLENQNSVLGLVVILKNETPTNTNNRRNETCLPEYDVVGREVEKEKLMNKLLRDESSSKENFSIVPIVGMGGVGKTTLARLLFNDPQVKSNFELMAWVCISDDFDVFKISDTILHLDQVESLSDGDALSLLARHALGFNNFDSQPRLRSKGEGIVKKCGGLPLALKAIGRLLRTKDQEEDWDDVLNSEIWDLEDCKVILPALRLSYYDLPAHLKQLFAYCSLFPKDFLFDKEELVLLWMAEGYLNQPHSQAPEHLGHEYFDKLLHY